LFKRNAVNRSQVHSGMQMSLKSLGGLNLPRSRLEAHLISLHSPQKPLHFKGTSSRGMWGGSRFEARRGRGNGKKFDLLLSKHHPRSPSLYRHVHVASLENFLSDALILCIDWAVNAVTRRKNKKLIRRWDSERELSLRRHRTRATKYNRLLHNFRHSSTRRLCVGTYVYQIQWNNAM